MDNQLTLNAGDFVRTGNAIDAFGSAEFPALFVALCAKLAGADSAHLSGFFADAGPVELYSTREEPSEVEVLSLNLDVGFVLDHSNNCS